MASLDTNCLLRLMLGDVPEQQARVEALLRQGEPLILPDVALIEALFALERGMGITRPTICEAVRAVLALKAIRTDRTNWDEVLDTWLTHPRLSVVDAYLAHRAKTDGHEPLYTFDTKMIRQLPGAATPPPP
jgi:predicted nucleic acid-binding protein